MESLANLRKLCISKLWHCRTVRPQFNKSSPTSSHVSPLKTLGLRRCLKNKEHELHTPSLARSKCFLARERIAPYVSSLENTKLFFLLGKFVPRQSLEDKHAHTHHKYWADIFISGVPSTNSQLKLSAITHIIPYMLLKHVSNVILVPNLTGIHNCNKSTRE